MSASSDAMNNLTKQWYNTLSTNLHLNPQQFQLVQGNIALGATSDQLWAMMDSLPPESITQYWTASGVNTFSSQYGSLISRLQDSSFGQFQHDMGDYYLVWTKYLSDTPPDSKTPIVEYFASWARSHIPDPGLATKVIGEFGAAMNGPIAQAQMAYLSAGGQTGLKAYDQSIEQVDNAAASAPAATVNLDTSTTSTDTTHTWAHGSADGFFDIFFGGGSSSYEAETSAVTSSSLNFSVKFDHMATIPIHPLSQGTKSAGPNTYQPWYVPAALSLGYANNNGDTWQPGTPDWNTFFGSSGSFPRAATSLLVVNGITVSLTSSKAVATSERTDVSAAFEAGFFPFFGVSGKGGWSSSQSFDANGRITATATCPLGYPQVLGILQSPIAQLVSQATMLSAMRESRSGGSSQAPSAGAGVTTEVRLPGAAMIEAVQVVQVAWAATALQGLHNLGVQPAVEQLIVGFVNTWATNNAPAWAVGSLHQYQGGPPMYTATAQVERDAAGIRIVNIVAFV